MPFEPNLMACTRMRDTAFKRVLRDLPLGTEVVLDAPYGSFTLHDNTARPAVFLTGGIGVTPVRSIVLQSVHDHSGHQITVFLANDRTQGTAFLDELQAVADAHPGVTFVPTISAPEASDREWHGETGWIDEAMLSRHVPEIAGPVYYLCGPPPMVAAMRGLLERSAVDPDDIRTEEFAGY